MSSLPHHPKRAALSRGLGSQVGAPYRITRQIGGWCKTCRATTKSPQTHRDKLCPCLSTTAPLESQQNGTEAFRTVRLQTLLINTHLLLHLLLPQPPGLRVRVFHSGWKLQQLQLQCSPTSPRHCPGDEGVPGPHPRTAQLSRALPHRAGCPLAPTWGRGSGSPLTGQSTSKASSRT